jgi:2-polyprenyl-3-methyl-5-hydroxy-6-metoxy-1,4-benzoquinol methylase
MKQMLTADLSTFMNYDYAVLENGDSAPAAVIRFVKPASKVLEIGAGSGAISRHLVKSKECNLTVLEINPESVAKLKKICSSVYSLDLNDKAWPQGLKDEGKFDHVIAADVLEHVYDPWTVLKAMKSLLSETGSIILSLPHASHSAVLAALYLGEFEFREWGLLDKTHIRFFGYKNVEALYASAGLKIVRCHLVYYKPQECELAHAWNALPENMREALGQRPYGNVYQIVTEAVPIERDVKSISIESCFSDVPASKQPGRFMRWLTKSRR